MPEAVVLRFLSRHFGSLLYSDREISKQIADHHARTMLAAYIMLRGSRQLPLDDSSMVERDGIVGAVLVVARDNAQQRHGRQRGEKGAMAAKEVAGGFVLRRP
jgi:hypothetical protein